MATFPEIKTRAGQVQSKWCGACHDPALMLAGKMDEEIDRTTPQAQAGLTCLACHVIDKTHNLTGNPCNRICQCHRPGHSGYFARPVCGPA